MKDGFQLILSGHYDRDPGLDKYILALTHYIDGQINEWTCTTSHVLGQQRGDQHTRGGLIPPCHHCKDLDKWEVDLDPIDMRHHKGVRGNFYRILPFEVETVQGAKRGDFGVHYDANTPGSLGCPVMDKYNWTDFENTVTFLKAKYGLTRLPLFPLYS